MKGDRFPIPLTLEILEDLLGAVYYTLLDFFTGYWQIRIHQDLKEMTTFLCRYGNFQFEVMTFGLINVHASFQRFMSEVFKGIAFLRFYLDDVDIFSKTLEEHVDHILQVIERDAIHGLRVKVKN